MPKDDIDYSNTIIYKIYCKNPSVTNIYVGHTTNFTQRKYTHKVCCKNESNKTKIYDIIRNNGGWENWEMEEIAKYNCKNSAEARKRENEHCINLKVNMNDVPKIFNSCSSSNIICDSTRQPDDNMVSNKPLKHINKLAIKETLDDTFWSKKAQNFCCEICDYNTSHKYLYDKHLLTSKHKKEVLSVPLDEIIVPIDEMLEQTQIFKCNCGKEYFHRQGLWKHSVKCNKVKPLISEDDKQHNDIQILTNLILEVVKQNNDLANKIVDICKTGQTTMVNSNNVISNNNTNTFNLNVFLNENCKDAMNITDFVDSIKLDIADLETVGKLGYVNGISIIIAKNLKALHVTERPIHCADKKREVIYIKDEDKWEREDVDKKKLKKVIKKVAYKNEILIPQYKQKYPDYNDSDSARSDQFSKIILEAMGGSGDNDVEKEQKILKNIAKEVVIDKTMNYLGTCITK
jgi:hypothetical protein